MNKQSALEIVNLQINGRKTSLHYTPFWKLTSPTHLLVETGETDATCRTNVNGKVRTNSRSQSADLAIQRKASNETNKSGAII